MFNGQQLSQTSTSQIYKPFSKFFKTQSVDQILSMGDLAVQGLRVVLDTHNSAIASSGDRGTVMYSVTPIHTFIDQVRRSKKGLVSSVNQSKYFQAIQFHLSPGFTSRVQISASVQEVSRDLGSYSLQDRSCRFEDELTSQDTLFEVYHPSLCQYTCSLKKTEVDFQCVPWDIVYPHRESETRICNGPQAARFKQRLENRTKAELCEECALSTCNAFLYDTKVHKTSFILRS